MKTLMLVLVLLIGVSQSGCSRDWAQSRND